MNTVELLYQMLEEGIDEDRIYFSASREEMSKMRNIDQLPELTPLCGDKPDKRYLRGEYFGFPVYEQN
jgi:hypothetical protein